MLERPSQSAIEPLEFKVERFSHVARELPALLRDHWNEVSPYRHKASLKPNWDRYFELDRLGVLFGFTARYETMLVGYLAFIITNNLYHQEKIADGHVLYMVPAFRTGWNAVKFLRFAEEVLEEEKIKFVNLECTDEFDLSPIFKYLGYKPTFKTYVKYIGDADGRRSE